MSASSSAANARTARRHNERSVLAELRRAGAASKPEIARRISLSPQAVNGIFDKLLRSGLIREGGRRGGTVGHPATLYAIRPEGAYAIGIDIGPRGIEIALIDFCGRMAWRAQSDYARPDPDSLRDALAAGLDTVQAHVRAAAIDPARIVGIGVSEPAVLQAEAVPRGRDRLSLAELLPAAGELPLHLERAAVVGALSLSMLAEEPLPDSYLYLAIGEAVEACLVLDAEVRRGAHERAGAFGAIPVPVGGSGGAGAPAFLPLGEVASFAALRRSLAESGFQAAGTDDFYAAMHERPAAMKRWIAAAADAVLHGAQAVQAVLDLDAVVLRVDPPNAIGEAIAARLRAGFAASGAAPAIRIDRPPTGSLASAAAAVALHHHFFPRLGRLTETGPAGPARAAADG